jgi:hypothetical protein
MDHKSRLAAAPMIKDFNVAFMVMKHQAAEPSTAHQPTNPPGIGKGQVV